MKYIILIVSLITALLSTDCESELFNIHSTKNSKIIDFIERLSDECEFTIIINDIMTKEILESKLNKTHIKNATINKIFSILLGQYNLGYKFSGDILKISYLETKVFSIDYILTQRRANTSTDITLTSSASKGYSQNESYSDLTYTKSDTESGMKIESTDEVLFWNELDIELQNIINTPNDAYEAEAPIINKNAGLISVTATSNQINRLESYLKRVQKKIQLQVLIDVQLLVVTMNEAKSTGIDWKQLYALQNISIEAGYGDKSQDTLSDTPSTYFTIQGGGTLKEVIKFLQTQGDVNSISNPKLLTLNNQPALITAGTEYFYKIKSTQTLANGTSGTQSENETIHSVFAGILLDITPEISDEKTITLKINPSLSETRSDMDASSSNRKMPPDLNRRQLSSVVTLKDANRVILGGLINSRTIYNSNKVPILGDIPWISYLFKYEEKIKQIQELVIIIEPHIIDSSRLSSIENFNYKVIKNSMLPKKSRTLNSDEI